MDQKNVQTFMFSMRYEDSRIITTSFRNTHIILVAISVIAYTTRSYKAHGTARSSFSDI